jgi:predicted esterase
VGGPGDGSYALYLPHNYREDQLSPVVFIFHPAARGRHGLLPFLAASEKYGYILICSNDSKNGPYDRNYEISNRLFMKVLAEFNVDPRRIYTAGFSGGARLASSIAVLSGHIQGVIACGAGFSPNEMGIEPGFSFAAIVGNRDFNYSELLRTRGWLNKLKFPNELFEFGMGHEWPDTTQVLKAFKWLQLEAFRKDVLPADPAQVMAYFKELYADGKRFEKNGELLQAVSEYERIFRNFRAYFVLDSIQARMDTITKDRRYIQQKRQWRSSLETENDLISHFYEHLSGNLGSLNPNIGWWERKLDRLREKYGEADPYSIQMLERVLSTVSAMAYEAANNKAEEISAEQEIFCYDLCILAYPDQPSSYLRQIEIRISEGDSDKAMDYLEKLIKSGFGPLEYLKNHSVVQPLKSHRRLNELFPQ